MQTLVLLVLAASVLVIALGWLVLALAIELAHGIIDIPEDR